MSIGINVEYHVSHIHTQNGLTTSFIKWLQLIARPLIMIIKLLVSTHAILHTLTLAYIKPTNYYKFSLLQLTYG